MAGDKLHLIGYASGAAGANPHCGEGPLVIQQSSFLSALTNAGMAIQWEAMIHPAVLSTSVLRIDEIVQQLCEALAKKVSVLVSQKQFLVVIGGDHTCAIGTWSGVYDAVHQEGDIGLIWIDAHMDSHTPETSESGRLHGMPLASLMGYGYPTLTSILHYGPKLKPENICLIGVRSFERGEAELLKRLNVRVYLMEEIKERGLSIVIQEAADRIRSQTVAYGLSLDLDSIDPKEAPGVGVPEPDGIHGGDLLSSLSSLVADPKLAAMEIVEFDPERDRDQITEKLIIRFLEMLVKAKK